MALNQRQIAALKPTAKMQNKGCGNGLNVNVEPESKGGGKTFVGSYNFKVDGKRKQIAVRIGAVGNKPGQYSLSEAMLLWLKIKEWAKSEGRDPRHYFNQIKIDKYGDTQPKTFKNAVDEYLAEVSLRVKETTHHEYVLKLHNSILPVLPGHLLLKDLEWKNGGREIVMNAIKIIENGDKYDLAHRCRTLVFCVFDTAISRGWMTKGQNPAERLANEKNSHGSGHHCTLDWQQVPELFEAVKINKCDVNQQAMLSLKMLFLTALRTGTLARLKWDWIDGDMFVIPGYTSGLKRTEKHKKSAFYDLHLPITPPMKVLLERLQILNGGSEYIFTAMRDSRYPFIDPSTPNNVLRNLGYKNKLVAHGWRNIFLTTGKQVLGFPEEIIRKQMGHLPEGKVAQAYDNSLFLDKRRDFMDQWSKLLIRNGLEL